MVKGPAFWNVPLEKEGTESNGRFGVLVHLVPVDSFICAGNYRL